MHRYACFANGGRHTFSECYDADPLPVFAPVKCPLKHRGKVTRKGTNNSGGAKHQRYKCVPTDGNATHTFTLTLPRQKVEPDPKWTEADAVQNPNRGPLASGRGHEFTMEVVAEGLQRISQGQSYVAVGKWAAKMKTPRERKVPLTKPVRNRNFWQTGAAWTELYAPVLWQAWQDELAAEERRQAEGTLPRVLVLDDMPFFGAPSVVGKSHAQMVFSALVAIEYYQPNPARLEYAHRVRLVRAYPKHTADAYELLVYECGFLPDVIISDSAHGILTMVDRLRKYKPDIVWVPSAFHVVKQLRRGMLRMTNKNLASPFVPGDLLGRMEGQHLLDDLASWRQWWSDLDQRMDTQKVPDRLRPNAWRKRYNDKVEAALTYLAAHPQVPRGNGALEAQIHNEVEPFFDSRSGSFRNIERVNRAADLLTLHLAGRLDRRADIVTTLTADALGVDGYMPPARQVNDPEGFYSLRDPDVLHQSLLVARRQAKARWGK